MTAVFWLLSLLTSDGLQLDARWRGRELALSGSLRSHPEGATLVLRFRRIVQRVEGPEGEIVSVPLEEAWDRRVAVERGTWHHREPSGLSGELGVEALLLLPSGLELPEGRWSFRAPPTPEATVDLRKRAAELSALLEGTTPRKSMGTAGPLTATSALLDSFLSDLARLREAAPGHARPLATRSGEVLTSEGLREEQRRIERILERERRLVLVRDLRELSGEIRRNAGQGRSPAAIDRVLGELLEAVRPERSDDLKRLAASVERLFEAGATSAEAGELGGSIDRLGEALERRLRGVQSP